MHQSSRERSHVTYSDVFFLDVEETVDLCGDHFLCVVADLDRR